jgi:hypothetical protein
MALAGTNCATRTVPPAAARASFGSARRPTPPAIGPEGRQAEAEAAAVAHEFASAHPAGKQAVDQLIVHLAMGAPEMVEKGVADFHAGLPW